MYRLLALVTFLFPIAPALAQDIVYHVKCSSEPLYEVEGDLLDDYGDASIRSDASDNNEVKPGDYGELSKYVETHLFGRTTGAWSVIGRYEVKAVTGDTIYLKQDKDDLGLITFLLSLKNHGVERARFSHYNYGKPVMDTIRDENRITAMGQSICGTRVGRWKFFGEDGLLKESYVINERSQKEGTYMSYFPNGQIKDSGNYIENNREGEWVCNYSSGMIDSLQHFSKGARTGLYRTWFASGQPHEIFYYDNNKKTGLCISYYENGIRERRTEYSYGNLYGTDSAWHINGQLKMAAAYTSDEPRDNYDTWYANGQHEQHREYDYWDHSKTGLWQSWYENGQLSFQCKFKSGKPDGKYREWYSNGHSKTEMNYVNGVRQKKCVNWYENGNKESEGEYKDDVEEGSWIFYYENGKRKSSGKYTAGKQVGTWKSYNEEGKQTGKMIYTN